MLANPEPTKKAEMADEVRAAIEELPKRQRDILERRMAGETTADIARVLGIDDATVRSQKRNAFTKIKLRLWSLVEGDHGKLNSRKSS